MRDGGEYWLRSNAARNLSVDHQEGYQPPITFRGGSSNIPQGVNEVSQV